MKPSQLHRQLELNLTAVSRSFRQALRFALKTDPQGTDETSAAWKTVAARQAMLLTMLSAVRQFLPLPVAPALMENDQPSPAPQPETSPMAPAEINGADDDLPDAENLEMPGFPGDPAAFSVLPPDLLDLHQRMTEVSGWPTHTHPQRTRRLRELERLQNQLEQRVEQMTASIFPPTG